MFYAQLADFPKCNSRAKKEPIKRARCPAQRLRHPGFRRRQTSAGLCMWEIGNALPLWPLAYRSKGPWMVPSQFRDSQALGAFKNPNAQTTSQTNPFRTTGSGTPAVACFKAPQEIPMCTQCGEPLF